MVLSSEGLFTLVALVIGTTIQIRQSLHILRLVLHRQVVLILVATLDQVLLGLFNAERAHGSRVTLRYLDVSHLLLVLVIYAIG